MTATLTAPAAAPVRNRRWWPRVRRSRTVVLVDHTTRLLKELLAQSDPRWGSVSWRRYGSVSSAEYGQLRVEIHHGDGSAWSPLWRLKVYAATGTLLADVDASSREVYGTSIPAQMTTLVGRLAA